MAFLPICLALSVLATGSSTAYAAGGDQSNPAVLQLPTDAGVRVATRAELTYTVSPTNGTLPAGQDLMQAERLYSSDGSVFLVPQTDGNLVLYNAYAVQQFQGTTPVAALWESGTYNNGGPQPYILGMQEDCNLVLYNGHSANGGPRNAGDAVFQTATYNKGVPPCSLTVSGAGGGGFVVIDSTGAALFSTLRVLGLPYLPNMSPTTQPALVYDIAAGAWSSAGSLQPYGPAPTSAQTRLHDGSVLVAGGSLQQFEPQVVASASIFSPASLTFMPTGSLVQARAYHRMVTTFNGSALAIGGLAIERYPNPFKGNYPAGTIESYNPYTGTWSAAGSAIEPTTGHASIVLSNGKVLTTGGYYNFNFLASVSNAELYDPVLGVSTLTGSMLVSTGRRLHEMVLLADGTALACGGETFVPTNPNDNPSGNGPGGTYPLFSCELYFPSNGSWVFTGNLSALPDSYSEWTDFTLSLLPNGQVLASPNLPPLACGRLFNLYDTQTRTWSVPPLAPACASPPTLLPTGELLLANSYTSVAECLNSSAPNTFPSTFPSTTVLYNPLTGGVRVTGSLPSDIGPKSEMLF